MFSTFCYHSHGSTPLMTALQFAHYECAAVLVAAGARLYLQNCRQWAAANFVGSSTLPRFLQKGLQVDPSDCARVVSLALAGHVQVHM